MLNLSIEQLEQKIKNINESLERNADLIRAAKEGSILRSTKGKLNDLKKEKYQLIVQLNKQIQEYKELLYLVKSGSFLQQCQEKRADLQLERKRAELRIEDLKKMKKK